MTGRAAKSARNQYEYPTEFDINKSNGLISFSGDNRGDEVSNSFVSGLQENADNSVAMIAAENDLVSGVVVYKCMVTGCAHDIPFRNVEEFVGHHNDCHRGKIITSKRRVVLGIYYCGSRECKIYYPVSVSCPHAVQKSSSMTACPPSMDWSITITVSGGDVPLDCFEDFRNLLIAMKSDYYIMAMERGEKVANLHIQAAAELQWDPEDSRGLVKEIRKALKVDSVYIFMLYSQI